MLSWSQDQDKKIGTTFGQIDPRVPSGLICKVFAQKFDVACSFVLKIQDFKQKAKRGSLHPTFFQTIDSSWFALNKIVTNPIAWLKMTKQ